jgi:hypothetical protein
MDPLYSLIIFYTKSYILPDDGRMAETCSNWKNNKQKERLYKLLCRWYSHNPDYIHRMQNWIL